MRSPVGRAWVDTVLLDIPNVSAAAFDSAPDVSAGTWHWCLTGNQVAWDDDNYRLHGLDPEIGPPTWATWVAAMHPDDRERAQETAREALEGGKLEIAYRVAAPDGRWRWLLGSGVVIRDQDGTPRHVAGTNIDINAMAASMAKALEAAHELADILGADDADPDRSQWLVRSIRDTLARAMREKITRD
jgi:PAS domain-containing protein